MTANFVLEAINVLECGNLYTSVIHSKKRIKKGEGCGGKGCVENMNI